MKYIQYSFALRTLGWAKIFCRPEVCGRQRKNEPCANELQSHPSSLEKHIGFYWWMGIGATNSLNWLPCPQFSGSCSAVKDDTPLAMSLTAKQEVLRWLNYWLAFGSNFHWHLRRFPNFIQNRRLAVPIPLFLLLYRYSTHNASYLSQQNPYFLK